MWTENIVHGTIHASPSLSCSSRLLDNHDHVCRTDKKCFEDGGAYFSQRASWWRLKMMMCEIEWTKYRLKGREDLNAVRSWWRSVVEGVKLWHRGCVWWEIKRLVLIWNGMDNIGRRQKTAWNRALQAVFKSWCSKERVLDCSKVQMRNLWDGKIRSSFCK